MRALVQRVKEGSVAIDGEVRGSIGRGYVILLGVRKGDTREDAGELADKCAGLRVMEDAGGKMNLGLGDTGGKVLVVSQFTLYGDTRRGNRPGFTDAAPPEEARTLYDAFVARMREALGSGNVVTGEFQAMMQVTIVNDGPVTLIIDSPIHNQPRSTSS
jgi:D-tyrosyl-tRNA(Tyr) deacylase